MFVIQVVGGLHDGDLVVMKGRRGPEYVTPPRDPTVWKSSELAHKALAKLHLVSAFTDRRILAGAVVRPSKEAEKIALEAARKREELHNRCTRLMDAVTGATKLVELFRKTGSTSLSVERTAPSPSRELTLAEAEAEATKAVADLRAAMGEPAVAVWFATFAPGWKLSG